MVFLKNQLAVVVSKQTIMTKIEIAKQIKPK